MSKVYYSEVDNNTSSDEINQITKKLLSKIVSEEKITLEQEIPLKVHFGEKGNTTFIKSENYNGIIDYLVENNISSSFMETCVLYGGQRYKKSLHQKTAIEHGFNRLPIEFADGECGEEFVEININQSHFRSCKIGKSFDKYNQFIIVAHFKGHMLAGFGGAIKQLSMGFASKGGKLAMHMGAKPRIIPRKCKKCNLCKTRCAVDALNIGDKPYIDHDKCIGCSACVATCPHHAISVFSFNSILKAVRVKTFREKLAEYALAAQKGKSNIYINIARSITRGCDCEPRKMKPIVNDFGVFISTDPVSIDKACLDLARKNGKKFKGMEALKHGEKIGLGSLDYELIKID